ncbi:hypothetical protein [Dechloromonas sp. HYN0024]|uniref:hypothetical protein n=1 Tax=Dechloromonas sp. HYN0024 TaxID=2231055 RepID=UPI0013C30885|nr:hypothetical protein [Dechloromonas sp. HYN0024]
MRLVGKILFLLAMAASLNVFAADPLPRKEAVMETGTGGLRLTISLPDYAEGPYDLSGKPGPLVRSQPDLNRVTGGAMFSLAIGKTAMLSYQASVARRFTLQFEADRFSAELLAEELIKQAGFDGRAVQLGCPPVSLMGANIVCYRMSGERLINGKASVEKYAHVLIAISFDHDKQGYTLMATIAEQDAVRFDADPARYEKIAINALGDLWKNHKIEVR